MLTYTAPIRRATRCFFLYDRTAIFFVGGGLRRGSRRAIESLRGLAKVGWNTENMAQEGGSSERPGLMNKHTHTATPAAKDDHMTTTPTTTAITTTTPTAYFVPNFTRLRGLKAGLDAMVVSSCRLIGDIKLAARTRADSVSISKPD